MKVEYIDDERATQKFEIRNGATLNINGVMIYSTSNGALTIMTNEHMFIDVKSPRTIVLTQENQFKPMQKENQPLLIKKRRVKRDRKHRNRRTGLWLLFLLPVIFWGLIIYFNYFH